MLGSASNVIQRADGRYTISKVFESRGFLTYELMKTLGDTTAYVSLVSSRP